MNPPSGFLNINKPIGYTSFQMVAKVRKISQVKVGHAGTLDPFASGVLVLALGREFTRQIEKIQNLPKIYEVWMVSGIETDTLDTDGKITQTKSATWQDSDLTHILPRFLGEQEQLPPIFSAKKVNGVRAYHLARKGQPVELKPTRIHIYSIQLNQIFRKENPIVHFTVCCSKGTYIRSLVRDINAQLGTCGHTQNLTRTAIGHFTVSDALSIDALSLESIHKNIQIMDN